MSGLFGFLVSNWQLSLPLIIIIIVLLVLELRGRGGSGMRLSPQHAVHFINQKKSLIVDLRSESAFAQGHIIKAQRFDEKTLRQDITLLQKSKSNPVLIVCERGVQAGRFATWLTRQGFENVRTLQGGIAQWRKDNLPLTTGK